VFDANDGESAARRGSGEIGGGNGLEKMAAVHG
jgi:hypothetical protein